MIQDRYLDGVLRERDDPATRTVTYWDEAGVLVPSTEEAPNPRPYDDDENAAADLQALADAERAAAVVKAEEDRAILDAITYLSTTAHTDGAAWVQPVGAHDAYPKGATVTHVGKNWESLIPANVWAPGVSGWREVGSEGYPAWVQPTGAHDDYDLGANVTHNGQDWTSIVPNNVWEPSVYGWVLI